jgi:hypothetical protein
MQLDLVYRSDREIYGIWGPIVIRIVDGAATETPDIDRVHGLLAGVLLGWPSAGMLLISHHGNPQPSLATTRYATQVMHDIEDRVVVGIALLGLGFWADTGRATTSFLMRLLRGNSVVLESSVEAVARRMALELVGIDAEKLRVACEELERRFRAQR